MSKHKINIPKSISIRGKRWTVHFRPPKSMFLSGKPIIGLTDKMDRKIYLSTALKGRVLEETFVHEVLHACIPFMYPIKDLAEERLVEEIDSPLTSVFKQIYSKKKK